MRIEPQLEAPLTYRVAPTSALEGVINGCGPGGWKYDVIPDHLIGVSIVEACNIHDWMYHEGTTSRDECDDVFRRNMQQLVEECGGVLTYPRLCLAWWYWRAVRRLGAESYGA